jgi:hypothetical protein
MAFFSHISPVFLLRSSAMQCKKAKIWKKNPYFSLQSKKFKPLHCLSMIQQILPVQLSDDLCFYYLKKWLKFF